MVSRTLDPCTIISVQTWDGQAAVPAQLEQPPGLSWPGQPWPRTVGVVASGSVEVLCTGPTAWLILAPAADATALLNALSETFRGTTFRASDVSSALARVEVETPDARTILSKSCGLDLDPSAFPPGRSARTQFAGMPIVIHRLQASKFECIVAASLCEYLLSWLADAAVEFAKTPRT